MDPDNELQTGIDRRKYRRFNIPLNIKFKPAKEPTGYSSGLIKNFSRYGFCFESGTVPLKTDDTVEFIVKLPTRETFIPILGDIVWTQNTRDKFIAGIRIKEIDKGAKSEILDFGYDAWLAAERMEKSAGN